MLWVLWNYLAGYVIIQVKGKGLERFLNRAVESGVDIWDVKRQREPDCITASVSVAGFYALHRMAGRGECRIHILKKRGLPITLSQFRFRKALLFGWIVVLALLLSATRCIWFIEVTGCDRVQEAEILAMLSERAVEVGTKRRDIAVSGLGEDIRGADPRIAWAAATLEGVVLTLDIREATKPVELPAEGEPASIYATRDGVITEITALSGRPMVNVGDAVLAGDLLISGAVGTEEAPVYVEARGTVSAKMPYVFSAECGPTLEKQRPTGESCRFNSLELLEWTLPQSFPYESYQLKRLERRTLKLLLPITVTCYDCCETAPQTVTGSREELLQAAQEAAQKAALRELPQTARIVSKTSETIFQQDGSVLEKLTLVAEQNICQTRRITLDD